MPNKKFLNYFKPKKIKVIISLLPFYFLFGLIPIWIELSIDGFMDTYIGHYLFGVSIIFYWTFLLMASPVMEIFIKLGLMDQGGGGIFVIAIPEITFPGLVILSLIYSILIYLIISFISYLRR